MSYQVLARKWRPQTFSQLVGQEHVVAAITNALENQRLHHAYLFTGTRGVGKTTIARIFSKSLNCEQGMSANPCGQCPTCREIEQGHYVDLLEIDAASRTKVEDTRELLDNVQYKPTRGEYKVYLIDEVHMLSKHSFNALLKTLEEPPPHVKFLLATTDPQKLPITILSRCLQFNLKALTRTQIAQQLQDILGQENVEAEPQALQQLAKAAHGSMRDALSLTDQAIAQGNGKVDSKTVATMLGLMDKDVVLKLLNSVLQRDAQQTLDKVEQLAAQAPNYEQVLAELLSLLHQVALTQFVPDACKLETTAARGIYHLAKTLPPEQVQVMYQIALQGRKDMPYAPDGRTGLEMVLLRMLAFTPGEFSIAPQTYREQAAELTVPASSPAQPEQHSVAPVSEDEGAEAPMAQQDASSAPHHPEPYDESDNDGLSQQQDAIWQQAEAQHPQQFAPEPPMPEGDEYHIAEQGEPVPFEAPESPDAEVQAPAPVEQTPQANVTASLLAIKRNLMQPSVEQEATDPVKKPTAEEAPTTTAEPGTVPVANALPVADTAVDELAQPDQDVADVDADTDTDASAPTDNAPQQTSSAHEIPPFGAPVQDNDTPPWDIDGPAVNTEQPDSAPAPLMSAQEKVTAPVSTEAVEAQSLLNGPSLSEPPRYVAPETAAEHLPEWAREGRVAGPLESADEAFDPNAHLDEVVDVPVDFDVPAFLASGEKVITASQLDTWSRMIQDMPIAALTKQLALHSSYHLEGDSVRLTLLHSKVHLDTPIAREQLQQALGQLLQREVNLTIKHGEPVSTPYAVQQQIQQVRLAHAQRVVADDPNIQRLCSTFAADVIEESIKAR
ncbi:DNA polymerase III subunit gamma/tau [Aestuariibacter halophilus]|uniref:DNA-directed DNA polymerase n=1 Tax=Fluctibacter halophilus TaxID=226011 RepID=A0ABS8G8A1_9ALTE|nr:DNA polymerase III subunit gamma/tau [Aestuariibacter halophilus]MCC2616326.1 DNA polymerase III subunit gamma/tau [Aestuariibacter halophilus]